MGRHLGSADTREFRAPQCGYRIGRLLVLRGALGQAPRSFSAATKAFCTEHETVAQFIARSTGPAAMLSGRASHNAIYASAYTIQGGIQQRAAQHHRRAGARASQRVTI